MAEAPTTRRRDGGMRRRFRITVPGDLNNSGAVDVQDLLILLANWG